MSFIGIAINIWRDTAGTGGLAVGLLDAQHVQIFDAQNNLVFDAQGA